MRTIFFSAVKDRISDKEIKNLILGSWEDLVIPDKVDETLRKKVEEELKVSS